MHTNASRTIDAIFEELSELVRLAYIEERRNWHYSRTGEPGSYKPGPRWDSTWPRMAEFFFKNQIDNYRGFIHLQFTTNANLACCPTPRQCYGPAALERWKQKKPSDKEIALSLHLQMHRMNAELMRWKSQIHGETERNLETLVLCDHDNTLTALFRYCMAKRIQREDIAEDYLEVALLRYLFDQDVYDRVWKELIPQELKDEAATMCLSGLTQTE